MESLEAFIKGARDCMNLMWSNRDCSKKIFFAPDKYDDTYQFLFCSKKFFVLNKSRYIVTSWLRFTYYY